MITSDNYHLLLESYERDKIKKTLDFLGKIKFFNEYSSLEMEKFHFFLNERLFNKEENVYSTGDKVEGIYFIKNGTFKVNFYNYYIRFPEF